MAPLAPPHTLVRHPKRGFDLGQAIKDIPAQVWAVLKVFIWFFMFIAALALAIFAIWVAGCFVFGFTRALFWEVRKKYGEERNRCEAQAEELTRLQEGPPAASMGETAGGSRGGADKGEDEDEEAMIGRRDSAETDGSKTLVP